MAEHRFSRIEFDVFDVRAEDFATCAVRELKEETNLELVRYLQPEPFTEQYQFLAKGSRIFKQVSYFIAEVTGEVKLQKQEIEDGKWVAFPEALDQVTHAEGKAILAQVLQLLPKL